MNAEKKIRVNCLTFLLFLGVVWGGLTSAQEGGAAKPQSQEEGKRQSDKKPKEKTFKPSEEISEDAPVPFPVDI